MSYMCKINLKKKKKKKKKKKMSSFNYKGSILMKMNRYKTFGSINKTG